MLTPYVPGVTEYTNLQLPVPLVYLALAETEQRGWYGVGHMPGKFVRIALSAADNSVIAEQRRHQMEHADSIAVGVIHGWRKGAPACRSLGEHGNETPRWLERARIASAHSGKDNHGTREQTGGPSRGCGWKPLP